MEGLIFSFEEFSVYDGPGIRTTVFLKGCPLSCSWCHNPEGQSSDVEIVRSPNGCIACGVCESYAHKKDGKYVYTEESIKNCPGNLLRLCGEYLSADALIKRLLKNERILSNGGGVTFSGGEPLYQSEFLTECLKMLRGRLHTAVQTSGFCREDVFADVLDLADYFLFDLKLADDNLHKKFTGVSNDIILKNFSQLAKSGKDFVVRIPLIPGVTDTAENIEGICKVLAENKVAYAELLPYNKMAGGKYKMTGREYMPGFDETKEVSYNEEIFEKYRIKIKVL